MQNRTDRELMLLVMSKQHSALEELYDRYVKLVYSFAVKAVKDEQGAREIVQLVFTRLWTTKTGFDESKGRFINWIITITRNLTIDYLRKQRKQMSMIRLEPKQWAQIPLNGEHNPETELFRKWTGEQIRSAYRCLSEPQVQLMEWMYWEGYSLSEIAEKMNEPLGTIKSRLHQCLKILRHQLTVLREG